MIKSVRVNINSISPTEGLSLGDFYRSKDVRIRSNLLENRSMKILFQIDVSFRSVGKPYVDDKLMEWFYCFHSD